MYTSKSYWYSILDVADDVIRNLHKIGNEQVEPTEIEEAKYQLEKIVFWTTQLKKIYRKK